jgi:glucosamine-6-phosphate deaminase
MPRVVEADEPEALLSLVRAEIERSVAAGDRIALPTGRTPLPLYRELAADPGARGPWQSYRYLQLDEYIDPPPGTETFRAALARHLFDPLGVPQAARGSILDPADPAEAARMDRLVAESPIALALLGLGANGHIAFNEPGDRGCGYHVVELSPATVAANFPGAGNAHRRVRALTIGLDQLLAARQVILCVPQREKQPLLDRVLAGAPNADLPASRLLEHAELTVFRIR